MEDLLGTCGDDCALACRLAEAHRNADSPLVVALVVLLLLFLVMDASIACVAIYRAGHADTREKTGATTQLSGGEKGSVRA